MQPWSAQIQIVESNLPPISPVGHAYVHVCPVQRLCTPGQVVGDRMSAVRACMHAWYGHRKAHGLLGRLLP